ncbi:MAG TPA: hypothetical protein VH440_01835 [Candidatus Limnocylindrales bacterium]
MTTGRKIVSAVVALVVVALLGGLVLSRLGGTGNVSSANPTPSPSPTASPLAVHEGALEPGRYFISPFRTGSGFGMCMNQPGCSEAPADDSIRFTFAVPEGWAGVGNDSIWLAGPGNAAPAGAGMLFERGGWLYGDPCHPGSAPDIEVGPTVDDFANALANHPELDVTDPVPTTLAGYSGKYVDLQVPNDLSDCPGNYYPWEPGLYAQGPGHRWHLWILDVNGIRVVVQSTDYAGTSADDQAALAAIVNSVAIEP